MLQEIRERTQGWIAWVVVVLITIPFALWGIQSYFGGGREPYAAKVNGVEIKERELAQSIQRARWELRERLGEAYDPRAMDGGQLREQVLQRLIEDAVLLMAAQQLGLRVPDDSVRAAILAEPGFQQDGRFDKAVYERVLKLKGFTPAVYEASLRQHLLAGQWERAIFGTAFAADSEVTAAIRLLGQKRDVAYLRLPRAEFRADEPLAPERLRAFYEQNSATFAQPEQVRIAYVLLTPQTVSAPVTEETLRARYEERRNEFMTPEKRRVRHILLTVPPEADAAAAEQAHARLLAIRQRILEGADFAAVATEVSEDRVSAAQGGELGEVVLGMLDPDFERQAFALARGELSEPLRTRFGYHLIQVTEIIPAQLRSFDEVRGLLAGEAESSAAEAAFFDQAERLATLAYETPDSLLPAAEALGKEIQYSDWFSRSGGPGLLAHPKVIAAAFSDDVLGQGHNSELIELDTEPPQALVLRVEEHRPAMQPAFEEVQEAVAAAVRERDASTAAQAAATQLVAQLQQGLALETAAAGREIVRPGWIDRFAEPAVVSRLAFELPRPAAGAVYGSGEWEGDAVVVAVLAVADGTVQDSPATQRPLQRRLLAEGLAYADFRQLVRDLVARARIERAAAPADRESGF